MSSSTRPRSHAFTLTELLVVIAVLAVLVTLLIPSASNLSATTTNLMCMNNLRHIGQAVWTESDGVKKVPLASWVATLRPHVDGNASVFRCPASSDYYATASAGKSGTGGTSPTAVDISMFMEGHVVNWYQAGKLYGMNGGIYSFNDDTPWSIHFSETQRWNRLTASSFQNRVVGSYQLGWGDQVTWGGDDYTKINTTVYDGGDGSGIHYWAVEIYSWGGGGYGGSGGIHYRFTKPFIKVEPDVSGKMKVWVSPESPQYPVGDPRRYDPYVRKGSGYNGGNSTDFCIAGKDNVQTLTNKGIITLQTGRAFAITQNTQGMNLTPGVVYGDLCLGQPPYLICSPNGYEDFLLLPPTTSSGGGPGPTPEPGTEEDLRTNYGMNEQAETLKNPNQIFAIDYVAPTVKISPAMDDWDTKATYDSNNDNVLDFARHRGKVNVLFVNGKVRTMDPDEINPKEAFIRQLYWQP